MSFMTFTSPGPITINDDGIATPYPSSIMVFGITKPVAKITISLNSIVLNSVY